MILLIITINFSVGQIHFLLNTCNQINIPRKNKRLYQIRKIKMAENLVKKTIIVVLKKHNTLITVELCLEELPVFKIFVK